MATTASIRVTKTFNYRGETREFSNRYHLDREIDTQGAFETFADNVVAQEKLIYDGNVHIVRVDYTPPDSELTEWTKAYAQAGTVTTFAGTTAPGDSAALLKYTTAERSKKNHPIYLFNYFHTPKVQITDGGQDTLSANYKTAIETYGAHWISGFSDGTHTIHRAGPTGSVALTALVNAYVTHRDLPR